MLIMEYGGPIYQVELTPDSAHALNTETRERSKIASITTEQRDEVTLKLYAQDYDYVEKVVHGRRVGDNELISTLRDQKVEEDLWDE
jgi:hypothetical protein